MPFERLRQLLQAISTGGGNDYASAAIPEGENRGLAGILTNFAGNRARAGIAQDQANKAEEMRQAELKYKGALATATEQLGVQRGAQARYTDVKSELEPLKVELTAAKTWTDIDKARKKMQDYDSAIQRREFQNQESLMNALNTGNMIEARNIQKQLDIDKNEREKLKQLHDQAIDLREQKRKEEESTQGRIPFFQAGANKANREATESGSRTDINRFKLSTGLPREYDQTLAETDKIKAQTETENTLRDPRKDALGARTNRDNAAATGANAEKPMTQAQRLVRVQAILRDKTLSTQRKRELLTAAESYKVNVDPAKEQNWTEWLLQQVGTAPAVTPNAATPAETPPADLPKEPGQYSDPNNAASVWCVGANGVATKGPCRK